MITVPPGSQLVVTLFDMRSIDKKGTSSKLLGFRLSGITEPITLDKAQLIEGQVELQASNLTLFVLLTFSCPSFLLILIMFF